LYVGKCGRTIWYIRSNSCLTKRNWFSEFIEK